MKRIFVTGGAGYVGAVVVPLLLGQGYEVSVFDLMIYGEDVLEEHPNLTKIKGDIRDKEALKKHIHGHDAVIHLACISNDPSFELKKEVSAVRLSWENLFFSTLHTIPSSFASFQPFLKFLDVLKSLELPLFDFFGIGTRA